MKKVKKLLCTLLVVVMCVVNVPMEGLKKFDFSWLDFGIKASAEIESEELAPNGQCGDNVYWSFDSDTGELVISGEGAMTDYSYYGSPFCSNTVIKTIVVEDGVTSVGECVFNNCNNITTAEIGNSVTSIGDSAFKGCYDLSEIEIPNSVTVIGVGAFYACHSLQEIEIHDNITNLGGSAFANCIGLTSVKIGKNVVSIGRSTFNGCLNLTQIIVDKENVEYSNDTYGALFNKDQTELIQYPIGNPRTSYSVPSTVRIIDDRAFEDCTQLEEITIHKNVTSIGMSAFSNCKNINKVYIDDLTAWCNIDFDNSTSNPLHDKWWSPEYYSATSLYLNSEIVMSLVIPEDVTTIKDFAFYGSNIFSVTIKGSVTSIGEHAFEDCENLINIEIEPGVTSIGTHAFTNTYYYNNDDNWENSVLYIGNYLIEASIKDSTTTYDIKIGTLCIADYALSGNPLISITIPNSVTNIGMGAFGNCKKLTNITIPSSVTNICDYTFYDCNNLTSITIPTSVTAIGNYAFAGCSSLTTVVIPSSVINIGDGPFAFCIGLKNITVEEENIAYCNDDNGVLFNKNKTQIVQYPMGISQESYFIPNEVISIGAGAFCGCNNLINILMPKSVTAIGNYAFVECSALTDIYYNGTQKEWDKISIAYILNGSLLSAIIHFVDDSPSHTHSYTSSQTNPTCTQSGSTTYTCSCGDTYTKTLAPTGHTFSGSKCTKCGYDRSDDCSCNCHKGGISGFFFKLLNFFQKLFGQNKVCACGAAH